MREVKLPSGAVLKITLAPFADSKALLNAVLEESKGLRVNPEDEVDVNLFKDIFCSGLSSKKIEAALMVCMGRVLYNDRKIDGETFEAEEARQDYIMACFEVASDNIRPFMKSLFAEFGAILASLKSSLTLKPQVNQPS